MDDIVEFETANQVMEREIKNIRPEILEFAVQMEKIMAKHDSNKGESWRKLTTSDAIDGIRGEFEELTYVFNPEEQAHECIDIANWCMIMFHILKEEF